MIHLTVVDDDDDDIDFFKEALSKIQLVEVVHHRDGIGLLALLRKQAIMTDAIVMELHLPIQGGYDTLLELKKTPDLNYIPVIILTSSILQEQQCLRAGCAQYFIKPNTLEEYRLLAAGILNDLA